MNLVKPTNPTPAQIQEILARPRMTGEAALVAIMEYVEACCGLAVAEATGFYNARTANNERSTAQAIFVFRMEQAEQETGP